ncbi:hypothetical protein JCM8097_007010 [Rhodosporidiobolus ruineniae]
MAESIEGLVTQILQNLPSGANPWTLIRQAFTAEVRPTLEDSFVDQLYVNLALLASTCAVLLACVFVKWRSGTYWLFKLYRATGGRYIVVHYSSTFVTFAAIFYGLMLGYTWMTVQYAQGNTAWNTALWRTLVWYPGFFTWFCATWSLCVSHILHLDSSGRPARSFFASAVFLNLATILFATAAAVSTALLGSIAHHYYHRAIGNFAIIDAAIHVYEASYTGTFDTTAFTTGSGFELAAGFLSDLSKFGVYFRWVFLTYLIFWCLLGILLVISATLHLRELRNTLHALRRSASANEAAKEQERLLEGSYRGLVWVTYFIISALLAVIVLFAFVGIAGRKVIYDAMYSKVASLLPLWLFSVIGLPGSTLFLIRLIRTSSPPSASADQAPATNASNRFSRFSKSSKSSEVLDAVSIPLDDTVSSVGTAVKTPTAEEYPMTAVSYGSYQPSALNPSSRGSPTFSHAGSDAPLVHPAPFVTTVDQHPYASYSSRSATGSSDLQGGSRKGWR